MSGSDEGDGGGPGLGRDLTDSGESPENAVTQLIPIVNPTPSAVDPPVVRAFARRAPAALPALGRDGGTRDTPKSVRDPVGRRQRAAAAPPTTETVDHPMTEIVDQQTADPPIRSVQRRRPWPRSTPMATGCPSRPSRLTGAQ